jgi:hypothetical protein
LSGRCSVIIFQCQNEGISQYLHYDLTLDMRITAQISPRGESI